VRLRPSCCSVHPGTKYHAIIALVLSPVTAGSIVWIRLPDSSGNV
jgi:hypothetical protein